MKAGTVIVIAVMAFMTAMILFTKMRQMAEGKDQFARCVEFADNIRNPFAGADYVKSVCKPLEIAHGDN